MAGKLDRIVLEGYKSIRELDLALSNLNVLIGANGAGKTNFISLFTLLRQIVEEDLQFYVSQSGGADSFLHFGQQTTAEIVIKLSFGRNGYDCTLAPAAGDSLIFADEACWYRGQEYTGQDYSAPFRVDLGRGHKESKLGEESRRTPKTTVADHVSRSMRNWRVYHFHDTSPSAKMKKTGNINDNIVLHPDASNLAAFLYLLQETRADHYQQIVKTVRMATPFFDDFVLRPTPENERKILLEWQEKGSDTVFDANYLSDGTLRFICLATLLLQPNLPAAILIDEPELGLHPFAITLLAALLKSAATKTQIITSTQSVTLVDQFEPEDIIVVDRTEEAPAARRSSILKHLSREDLAGWLEDYSLGELWQKNLLGGRPR